MDSEEMRNEISGALVRCEAQELQMESDLKKLRQTEDMLRSMLKILDAKEKPGLSIV